MPTRIPAWLRPYGAAARVLLLMTAVLGLAYPLAVTGAAQLVSPSHAEGSLIERDGEVVGSSLIGQNFNGKGWFHPRPSAAGDDGYDGYDGDASSASNLSPNSEELLALVRDPHISPAYAGVQIARVAEARNLPEPRVRDLVAANTDGRGLGFIGEPAVNVITLNRVLADLE